MTPRALHPRRQRLSHFVRTQIRRLTREAVVDIRHPYSGIHGHRSGAKLEIEIFGFI